MLFLLRRLAFYLAAFLAAATVNFFLPRLMPGDPIQIMFASAGSELSLENLNALKLTFGFIDAPLGQQYLAYLQSVFTGDLGRSIKYFPLPVTELLGRALMWTTVLVGTATILSFTLGTFMGGHGGLAAWIAFRRDRFAPRYFRQLHSGSCRVLAGALCLRLHARLVPQRLCRRSYARSRLDV